MWRSAMGEIIAIAPISDELSSMPPSLPQLRAFASEAEAKKSGIDYQQSWMEKRDQPSLIKRSVQQEMSASLHTIYCKASLFCEMPLVLRRAAVVIFGLVGTPQSQNGEVHTCLKIAQTHVSGTASWKICFSVQTLAGDEGR